MSRKKVCAILLCAGSGNRMNADTTKQLIKLCGESVVKRTVRAFDAAECIDNISNEGNNKIDLYFSRLDDNILNNIKNIMNCEVNSINLE